MWIKFICTSGMEENKLIIWNIVVKTNFTEKNLGPKTATPFGFDSVKI